MWRNVADEMVKLIPALEKPILYLFVVHFGKINFIFCSAVRKYHLPLLMNTIKSFARFLSLCGFSIFFPNEVIFSAARSLLETF